MDWVDVNLVPINPQGAHIHTSVETWNAASDMSHLLPVLKQIQVMRRNGHSVIGMKLIGNGDSTKPEDREKSMRFTLQSGLVDAAVTGFKSTADIA